MRESELMKDIQLAMTKAGHRVFRNQVGTYKLEDGRWLSSGLCEGSSDLIGWTSKGRFLAIEVKAPGARTKKERLENQAAFLAAVNKAGGIGFFTDSVDDALTKISMAAIFPPGSRAGL